MQTPKLFRRQRLALYRNVEGRWSDGRIHNRRKPKRQNSRDSPFRSSTAIKKDKEKRLSSAGARIGLGYTSSEVVPHKNLSQMRSMSMIESVEVEVLEDENGHLVLLDAPLKPSPSYSEAINAAAGSIAAIKNNRIAAIKSEYGESNKNDESIAAVMLDSTSTMMSSLERSLEMAVGASDGLSDKESKLKAVKTHFKTHRRTASNPVPIVTETSTESDNDPVYC